MYAQTKSGQWVRIDEIHGYPVGGGFHGRLKLDHVIDLRMELPDVPYSKAQLRLGDGDETYEGWVHSIIRWNGWQVPAFENHEARRIVERLSDVLSWDGVHIVHTEVDFDEEVRYELREIQTVEGIKQVWFIGDGWCWEDHEGS